MNRFNIRVYYEDTVRVSISLKAPCYGHFMF